MAKDKVTDGDARRTLFAVKGTTEWFEWLKEYADFLGMPVITTIDYSLREQSKRDKFPKPMPKRFTR